MHRIHDRMIEPRVAVRIQKKIDKTNDGRRADNDNKVSPDSEAPIRDHDEVSRGIRRLCQDVHSTARQGIPGAERREPTGQLDLAPEFL
jgi:hypothetical protein